MKARSGGVVVVLAVGLTLAVAVPAGAQAPSTPAQQIVTAVAGKSTLSMKAGYSHYLFVGGSAAQAVNAQSTFGHVGNINCEKPRSQGPMGPSIAADPQGSFTTTGSVSAIAGVGISGYSVRRLTQPEFPAQCSSASGVGVDWSTLNFAVERPGTVVVLIGTDGVGLLAPTLLPYDGGTCPTATVLRNETVSNGQSDGAAVAVLSVHLKADDTCFVHLYGMTYTDGSQDAGFWLDAYILVPNGK